MIHGKNIRARGFTLIELLISVVILMLILLAVYNLFDQGQWLYLQGANRTTAQDSSRQALEAMERDLRMAGSGVPSQARIDTTGTFTPMIFEAEISRVSFRADIDSGNTMATSDTATNVDTINVQFPDLVCPTTGTEMVITTKLKKWQPVTCNSKTVSSVTFSPNTATDFPVEETEVFTPEHIFFRLTDDADNDGTCDLAYPFCEIQRAEVSGNTVLSDSSTVTNWATLATNVQSLNFEYYLQTGTSLGTSVTGTSLSLIGRVVVVIVARERSMSAPGNYQDVTMKSEILVRN